MLLNLIVLIKGGGGLKHINASEAERAETSLFYHDPLQKDNRPVT